MEKFSLFFTISLPEEIQVTAEHRTRLPTDRDCIIVGSEKAFAPLIPRSSLNIAHTNLYVICSAVLYV